MKEFVLEAQERNLLEQFLLEVLIKKNYSLQLLMEDPEVIEKFSAIEQFAYEKGYNSGFDKGFCCGWDECYNKKM